MPGKERRTRCYECKRFFHKQSSIDWVRITFPSSVGEEIALDCSADCAQKTVACIPTIRKNISASWRRDRGMPS